MYYVRGEESGYIRIAGKIGESEPHDQQNNQYDRAYGNPYTRPLAAVMFFSGHILYFLYFHFDTELEDALCSESGFGEQTPTLIDIELRTDRYDLECAVSLAVAACSVGLHV